MEVIISPIRYFFLVFLKLKKLRAALKKITPHHQFEYIPPNIWNFYILGILFLQSNYGNGKVKSVKEEKSSNGLWICSFLKEKLLQVYHVYEKFAKTEAAFTQVGFYNNRLVEKRFNTVKQIKFPII